jgi:hypothetical protein
VAALEKADDDDDDDLDVDGGFVTGIATAAAVTLDDPFDVILLVTGVAVVVATPFDDFFGLPPFPPSDEDDDEAFITKVLPYLFFRTSSGKRPFSCKKCSFYVSTFRPLVFAITTIVSTNVIPVNSLML